MTERILPKPSKYEKDELMTDKDWDYYFECRKNDKPMSNDEKIAILKVTTKLNSVDDDSPDMPLYEKLIKQIPVPPSVALALKWCKGIKAVQEFNLYEAKLAYPDEF